MVLALAVVATITVASGGSGPEGSVDDASSSTTVSLPIIYAEAEADGSTGSIEWGPNCDPTTGRISMPTVYAAPCVPLFEGDNGGATSPGVTADTIKIVNYIPTQDGDVQAALAGAVDGQELQTESEQHYFEMLEDLYETYGRQIELVDFQATGSDPVASRADAVTVAKEIAPFASLGGPALNQAYAEELAANGILCIGCGMSAPDHIFQSIKPYMWGTVATAEQYFVNVGDYLLDRVTQEPAIHAGGDLQGKDRVVGVVHFDQEPPVFDKLEDSVADRAAAKGYAAAAVESYTLDLAKAPERAATIIAKMKSAGVTTIMFLGDPMMPIYLTKAATEQDYFPEWIVTGTVYTDTNLFGRRYDQAQWQHAFGLATLPVTVPVTERESWRLHEWYFGEPPAAARSHGIVWPNVAQLMMGIHLAGPDLTPEAFRDGLFRMPPAGGTPTAPRVSYGSHAGFAKPDFAGVDDMAEVWWDADAVVTDEAGEVAVGGYRYVDGGRRFQPGEMSDDPPKAFIEEGSVLSLDSVPADERWPEYPPPAGSPAGG